jgi:hypothetical protein
MVNSNISVKLYRENCGAQQPLPCFLVGEEKSAARQCVANAGEGCLCVPLALSSFGPGRKK